MAKIEIPTGFLHKLGPEMKMDVHWIDVKLVDGRILRNLVVRGSRFITGRDSDPNGEGDLPFEARDIRKLRRTSILPFFG